MRAFSAVEWISRESSSIQTGQVRDMLEEGWFSFYNKSQRKEELRGLCLQVPLEEVRHLPVEY